jgi:uncharacterized protein YqjF (DUF2071 family)
VTPVMFQDWNWLTFVHWRFPAQTIAPFLPRGLQVDTFDGSAWVGMTPFYLSHLRPRLLPAVPWISHFPETNVRTYVRDRNGYPGIWFFSLDAARLTAVVGARMSYGLPYKWARMSVKRNGNRIHYRSSRIREDTAFVNATFETGLSIHRGDLEFFLTERYRLYTILAGRLAFADVEHEPWPLQQSHVIHLEQSLLRSAGLPPATEEPLVLFSRGVRVAVGRPHWL